MSSWLQIEFEAPFAPALPNWLRRRERFPPLLDPDEPAPHREVETEHCLRPIETAGTEMPLKAPRASPVVFLLALGRLIVRLVEERKLHNYAQAARAMGLSRARITQITNLTWLAPDIQAALTEGRIQCSEHALRPCLRSRDWGAQRRAVRPFRRREGGRQFRYTKAQRRALLEELETSTESIAEFAHRYGIVKSTIEGWRSERSKELGLPRTMHRLRGIDGRFRTAEARRAVVEDYLRSGLSLVAFSRSTLVNRRTLCGWVLKHRERTMSEEERTRRLRRRIYSPEERARMIAEVEATGASARSVALKHGVSSTCLNTWLRARNRGPTNDARDAPTVLLRGS